MAYGHAREGKRRGNWRMEWVAGTLHTTSEHCVSSITTADAHTSATSSRLNRHPRRFKWTRPFRRKTKYGFCACAITFQQASTYKFKEMVAGLYKIHWHTGSKFRAHAGSGGGGFGPKGRWDLSCKGLVVKFMTTFVSKKDSADPWLRVSDSTVALSPVQTKACSKTSGSNIKSRTHQCFELAGQSVLKTAQAQLA